jgi:hypothetical protein
MNKIKKIGGKYKGKRRKNKIDKKGIKKILEKKKDSKDLRSEMK